MTGKFGDNPDFVIGRGVVADGAGLFLEDGALLVSDGRVVEIGPWETVRRDGIPFFDVEGRLILPGLSISTTTCTLSSPREFPPQVRRRPFPRFSKISGGAWTG